MSRSIDLACSIVEGLVGLGVTDVVLSPGSRSAALALVVQRAEQCGRLRLHVRIDERVAGFTALGLAKETRRAVAVITTSGTATANLAPAAMEARSSGIPLVFITADRPAHLVGTGANQTGDQLGILGPSAVGVIRLSCESGDADAWAAAVSRAVTLAQGARTRRPGPVQLNAEFVPPLVGELPDLQPRPFAVTNSTAVEEITVLDNRRTVILVGDASPEVGAEARALAELSGAPLLAEPSSNARCGTHAISNYLAGLHDLGSQIQRVICYGHPTLSRPVTNLLSRRDLELVVVSSHADWIDPGHQAAIVTDRVQLDPQDSQWLIQWQRYNTTEAQTQWGTQGIVDQVLAALGRGDDLFLGASNTVRAADRSPISSQPCRVFANRGLAGIDGTLATATGLALASGRPTTVILGDLTMQHDLGALVRTRGEIPPQLRVVVIDDGGGAIFRGLEQGGPEYADAFDRVFLTPQSVDLAAVARGCGWRSINVSNREQLQAALASDAEFIVAQVTSLL